MVTEVFEVRRLKLQTLLELLLGSKNVYFQPPESVRISYPCIIYSMNPSYVVKADNQTYIQHYRFHLQHIYKDFGDSLIDKIPKYFMYCSFDNRNIVDSLYHDEYTIFF